MVFEQFTHLTFDCYGTLIDWETGILQALMPRLAGAPESSPRNTRNTRNGMPQLVGAGAAATEEEVLSLYTQFEAEEEAGDFKPYRVVLENVARRTAKHYGAELAVEDRSVLPDSVGRWPPFPDTVAALTQLKARFKLVILSNIDDALFAQSNALLGVTFDEIITAEQVRSYKPRPAHFEEALRRLAVPRSQILHVAQSLYHDHVPAKALGFSTVRIDRPSRLPVSGLAPPADVRPDLALPDLQSLVRAVMG